MSISCARTVALLLFVAAAPPAPAGAQPLDRARELHAAGRLEEAMGAYRELLALPGLDDADAGVARNNLCVLLDQRGDHRAAVDECRLALELRRRVGDDLRTARTLNNLGLALQHLGSYDEAEGSFERALEINQEIGDRRSQIINLANLGGLATLAGRFDRALTFHDRAGRLAAEHLGEPWAAEQIRIATLNRGVVLERLGAHREALELYRSLLADSDHLSSRQQASVLVNSGVIYRNLGDPVEAIERFEAAARLYEELEDLSGLGDVTLNLAIAADLNLNQLERAEVAYRRALEFARTSGDRTTEIEGLTFLGRLLLKTRRLPEAESVFASGLELARQSGLPEGVWSALAGLGQVALALGELERASEHFESAAAAIETARGSVEAPSYRAAFFADKREVYAGAAVTLAELDQQRPGEGFAERALEIAQQAKARDLADALGTARRVTPALSLPELLSRLGEDLLIEFLVTPDRILVWRVGGGSLSMLDLGDPAPLEAASGRLRDSLIRGEPPAAEDLDLLSRRLRPPLALGLPERGDLRVAADAWLHYLPFELLRPSAEDDRLLIERAVVAYLPSAWALRANPPSSHHPVSFLGLGDVRLSDGEDAPPLLATVRRRFDLRELPRSRAELESIAERLPGRARLLTGEEATESGYREASGQGAGVLHFATHTVIAEGPSRGAAIVLSADGRDDGLLHPEEIAGSPARTSLTVLAACSTGFGAPQDGRALTSLTGAFLAAGSPAVVATLWEIGDQPTSVFMQQFYYQLSRGLDPAAALREAKLALLSDDRWRAPHLWSGYVLVGKGPPVVDRRPLRRTLIALGLLTLGAALTLALAARGGLLLGRKGS